MPIPATTEDETARTARRQARAEIIQAANRYRVGRARAGRFSILLLAQRVEARTMARMAAPKLYSGRHIQQAVAVARQHHLVPNETLAAAGYRAAK